jgi:hypothetical protein
MGESKSARTLNNINAYSEYGAESTPRCINRLAGISEWTTTKPGSGRAADLSLEVIAACRDFLASPSDFDVDESFHVAHEWPRRPCAGATILRAESTN